MKGITKVIAICTLIILFCIVIQVQSSLAETYVTPEQFMDLIKAKIDFYSFPRIGQANVWTRDTVMTQYYDENSGYVIYLYVNKDGSVRRVEFQRYNKPVNSISGNVASIALSKLRYKPTLSINPDPPSNDFGTMPEGQTRLWDFRITNGGGGTLSWSAGADQSWIAVSPESGTTTTGENTVTVIIDTQGLSQGRTYRGYVTVSSNGESKKGTISVTIPSLTQEPKLCINPDLPSNDFGTVPEGQTRLWDFRITNGGGGTLSWSASADQSWMAVSPESGTTTTGENTVTVIIDTQGLSQGRTYSGYVTVSSNGESKKGTISVTIPALTQEPKLCINPDPPSNDFGTMPEGQTRLWDFRITNGGGGTLSWSASADQSWIAVSPESGTTTTGENTVTVIIDTQGLSQGRTYRGYVTVSSNGESKKGTISVTIPALTQEPKLCINPDPPSNDFGTMPEGQTRLWDFRITNGGGGTLSWSAGADQSWIAVSPESGTTTTGENTVTVIIDTQGLSQGRTYRGYVTVSSNGESKKGTISVTIPALTQEPKLCINPDLPSNDFGTVPEGQTRLWDFRITNGGGGTLSWSASADQSWIAVSPESGTTTTGENTVTVIIDTQGLSQGRTYRGYVTVSSNGESKKGTISVTIPALTQEPKLCINPDPPSNDFGTMPEGQTRLWDFRITNGGGGTLSWSASADQSWIAVSPESGTTTTGENTVTVIIDTQGLSQGRTYRGYVTVSSNGESKKGTISVTIPALTQEPKLCINPDLPSNDFGTVPENQIRSWDFSVENCGGNTLTWSTSTDQPWITVNPKSGITTIETDLVTVTIDSLDMSPRTYTGHVTVSSNGGSKTGTIAVTIPALTQEPKLCINPDPPSNDFGTVPENQIRSWDFSVENCGGNTLTWSTSTDQPWIMVNPKSGTTTIDSDTVTVAIDTYRLSPGSYTGHVTVSSNGGNNTGTISANLIRGPPLETVQIDSNGYAIFKEIRTVIRKIRFLPGSSGNVTITEKLNFSKSYYVIIEIKVPKNLKNSSGDICFQAKKEWLKCRDCRNEDVELYRKDDNDGWVALGANWQTKEGEYVQYEANTFAFSEFKIDLVKDIEDRRRERDMFWVMIASIVIGVVIGVPIIIFEWRQSRKNGGKNNINDSGGEAEEEDFGNTGEKEKKEKEKEEESKEKSEEKSSEKDK